MKWHPTTQRTRLTVCALENCEYVDKKSFVFFSKSLASFQTLIFLFLMLSANSCSVHTPPRVTLGINKPNYISMQIDISYHRDVDCRVTTICQYQSDMDVKNLKDFKNKYSLPLEICSSIDSELLEFESQNKKNEYLVSPVQTEDPYWDTMPASKKELPYYGISISLNNYRSNHYEYRFVDTSERKWTDFLSASGQLSADPAYRIRLSEGNRKKLEQIFRLNSKTAERVCTDKNPQTDYGSQ